jgi:hypothetical protein
LQKSLLVTITSDEGAYFIDPNLPEDADVGDYVAQIFPEIGDDVIQAAAAQYKGLGSGRAQATLAMGECE